MPPRRSRLPSHATLLTGRYPPGHGSRDNGLRASPDAPTLGTELRSRGFRTAAFVAAFRSTISSG
jgi:arylsulfatase A-like enzyme